MFCNQTNRNIALSSTEHKLNAAEQQVNHLQARLNEVVHQRKHWENEYNKVKVEIDAVSNHLETSNKQLQNDCWCILYSAIIVHYFRT